MIPGHDTGSPSISKTEDNLSNSDGPLLRRSFGKNNITVSSDNVSVTKTIISKNTSKMSCRDVNKSTSPFESPKKRYCLWALTFILAIVGLSNLLLSITIIAVLRVSQGMEAMEVIPEESLVKFYGRTDLDKVCVEGGVCQGYGDEPIELSGDNAGIQLSINRPRHDTPRANFNVLKNGTEFSLVDSFEVKDSRTGNAFFSTNFPNFGLPNCVGKLAVKLAETRRIVSPVNSSLNFDSNRQITIHGAESTIMESRSVVWTADNDINIKSNRSIVLEAKDGIFIDTTRIPSVQTTTYQSNNEAEVPQYKVCICMPQGKLFRMPIGRDDNVRIDCARVSTSPEHDPCQ